MKRASLVTAFALLALVPGCRSKIQLDNTVDEIVGALSDCDHPRLDAQIAPELAKELDAKFDGMCKTVQWFGPLEERRQTGISVTPSSSKGNYELTFENGSLDLELVLTDDRITGFEFTGDDWFKAKSALEAEAYAEFKVYGFDWIDPDGTPHSAGNKYAAGTVAYKLEVGGIESKDGKFHLELTTRIKDAKGAKLWESPKPDVLKFDQDDRGIARSGSVNGSVTIPDAGTYQIEYEIKDVKAGEAPTYTQAVIIG